MSQIDQIRNDIDNARGQLQAMGFREFAVTLRQVTYAGGDAILGKPGTPTNVDTLIVPAPKVLRATDEFQDRFSVQIQSGDIIVEKISRSASFEALVLDRTTDWVVDGPNLDGVYERIDLDVKVTEHVVLLRRKP